jgi:stalled ribosome alternative rescue factor ArfA
MAVSTMSAIFCDVMQYNPIEVHRHLVEHSAFRSRLGRKVKRKGGYEKMD